jgi:hypothetical protein
MVWWSGPQRRNEKKSAIELGHVLDVGDVEGDVAELERDNPLVRETLSGEGVALEHLHDRSLGILEGEQVRDRGLRVLFSLGLGAVLLHLLLERIEIVVGADLKADARALRLRALAHDHGVMIDGRGEIDRVLVLARNREAEDLGVILDLLVDVGHLVSGVGDLLDADHVNLRCSLFD